MDGRLVREDDLNFFARRLGASEARRYASFLRSERRRQFLLGRMLLRFAVAKLLGLSPDEIGVIERHGSAPQLALAESQRLPRGFSLSHSGHWLACVVSADATLGVDIEINDPTRDIAGISQLALHSYEHRWLLSQRESARCSAFYNLWCTKEALYKLFFNVGRETVLPPLVDDEGTLASQGYGWHSYTVPHSDFTLVIGSDRPLPSFKRAELTELSFAS